MQATASNLESARWLTDQPAALLITGWVTFTDHRPVTAVSAVSQQRVLASQTPSARPDVHAHHGGAPSALLSGFSFNLPPVATDAVIELQATDDAGKRTVFYKVTAGDLPGRSAAYGDYAAWAARHDPDPAPAAPPAGPRFSILLPVYRTPPSFLRECLDSVAAQHYRHWELVIVDDASGDDALTAALAAAAARDSRIRVITRNKNGGIARATNDALAAATAEFIVLLDHDDRLRPHALAELAAAWQRDPAIDALYSDEDKITADGRRLLPLLKPAFSPDFLLGVMYPGHVLCVRLSVARATGGFDPAFDGVQDYEFFLRVTEHTRRIAHVPKILYHWRQSPGSSALHGNVKGDMNLKQADAVRAHLRRRGDPRSVTPLGGHRVRLQAAAAGSFEIVRRADGVAPTVALRHAAAGSPADVLVLLDPGVNPGDWTGVLAAMAARTDTGCAAPVLLSREGPVLEAGWTTGPSGRRPLMRGFDPTGDGAHGSLRCDREVAAVSPRCFAVRRELAATASDDWWKFCESLRAQGLYHRVCAAVQVPVDASWREMEFIPGMSAEDPFFNRHYDRKRADYSLAALGDPAFFWHLDTALTTGEDGCLELRGWCFRPDGEPCAVQVTVSDLVWSAPAQLPRPDVARAHPGLTAGACGFSLRLRVPPGRHQLTLAAVGAGETLVLRQLPLAVSRLAPIARCLVPTPARLLRFQLQAAPSHGPRPLRKEKFPARASTRRLRFAIVTPSFNQAPFLGETLRSVLGQPVDCDYVVQDGGSTDGSVALIRAQAEKLKAWESAPDGGQADAIARGFARTTGAPDDIMAWINSDDFYLPGALEFVADYFSRNPTVDALYGHRILVDENSREVGRWFLPPHDDEILRLNDFVPQETLFWRRRLWDRVGGIDRSFQFAMDWDLLLRFSAAKARIERVPYFLGCFRIHSAQKTSARIHDTGRREIGTLRARAQGRTIPDDELEADPRLFRYLRQSAAQEFLHDLWS